MAEIRRVHVGHVRLPGTAHAEIPVTRRVTSTVDLRRVGLGCPDDPRPIGEEDSVHFGEALVELAQVHDRLPRVPILDTFAEPEARRVGLQNVEIAVLSGLDRGGDAPGDGVLLSEMFALLNANRLGEKEAGEREDGEDEHDHGCIDRARAAKPAELARHVSAHNQWKHGCHGETNVQIPPINPPRPDAMEPPRRPWPRRHPSRFTGLEPGPAEGEASRDECNVSNGAGPSDLGTGACDAHVSRHEQLLRRVNSC